MPLTEKQWTTFARDLQRALVRVEPEWTDSNAHDPGITVLEVLSYVITALQQRGGVLDDRARGLARSVAERATALASADEANDDCGPGLQRVNYAYGMVLGVDDFNAEQDYFRRRLQRHNRLLHGAGIAIGLEVSAAHDSTASRITVAPGLALDPAGNEIHVEHPVCVALPAQGTHLFVLLRYVEIQSMVHKALLVLKLRGSDHDKDIRQYVITPNGLEVHSRFEGTQGIMSGSPTMTHAEAFAAAFLPGGTK